MVRIQISGTQGEAEQKTLTEPVVLGRDPECDLVINDQQISRRHCRIEPQQDGVLVIDLNSRNGVYVNGERLMQCLLKPGEVLAIGNSTLRLEISQQEDEPVDVPTDVSGYETQVSMPVSDSTSTTIAPTQEAIIPKPRLRDSFTHRQAMWEKAAATREDPEKSSAEKLLARLKRSSGSPQGSDSPSAAIPLKKKIAIGFAAVALAALLYQASTYLHSDNAVSPVNNSQARHHQTAKNRAISD